MAIAADAAATRAGWWAFDGVLGASPPLDRGVVSSIAGVKSLAMDGVSRAWRDWRNYVEPSRGPEPRTHDRVEIVAGPGKRGMIVRRKLIGLTGGSRR